MSILNCSKCVLQISSDVEKCPQCESPTRKPFLQKTMGCLGLVLIFMVFIVLFSLLHGRELAPKSATKDLSIEAVNVSQEFITRKLRIPFTAKFPIPSQARVINGEKNQYKIISYVDAQNSYGKILRKNYECVVRYESEKDRWYLVKVTFGK